MKERERERERVCESERVGESGRERERERERSTESEREGQRVGETEIILLVDGKGEKRKTGRENTYHSRAAEVKNLRQSAVILKFNLQFI